MHLERFIHSTPGKYIISILIGLGLSTLFRQMCREGECRVLKAPDINAIENKTFKYGGKCVQYEFHPAPCDAPGQSLYSII